MVSFRVGDLDAPPCSPKDVGRTVQGVLQPKDRWLVGAWGSVGGGSLGGTTAVHMVGLVPAPCLIVILAGLRKDVQVVFPGVVINDCTVSAVPGGLVVSFDVGGICVLCFHPGEINSGAAQFLYCEIAGSIRSGCGELLKGIVADGSCDDDEDGKDDEDGFFLHNLLLGLPFVDNIISRLDLFKCLGVIKIPSIKTFSRP